MKIEINVDNLPKDTVVLHSMITTLAMDYKLLSEINNLR